ncbi:hypothetical protein PMIN06_011494 [Paraphaeosphaeria minitans]
MPRDPTGQLHAGTIGLFDDEDEPEATALRNTGRAALVEPRHAKPAALPPRPSLWHVHPARASAGKP